MFLRSRDVVVHAYMIALKDRNPIETINFFSKWDANGIVPISLLFLVTKFVDSFPLKQEDISLLIPKTVSETYVRIYCRDSNPEKVS
jgi:hypothetical protein